LQQFVINIERNAYGDLRAIGPDLGCQLSPDSSGANRTADLILGRIGRNGTDGGRGLIRNGSFRAATCQESKGCECDKQGCKSAAPAARVTVTAIHSINFTWGYATWTLFK